MGFMICFSYVCLLLHFSPGYSSLRTNQAAFPHRGLWGVLRATQFWLPGCQKETISNCHGNLVLLCSGLGTGAVCHCCLEWALPALLPFSPTAWLPFLCVSYLSGWQEVRQLLHQHFHMYLMYLSKSTMTE